MRFRAVSATALVGLVGVTCVATWATRVIVRDQENRLLRERASEVGLVLSASISGVPASLSSLGGIVQASGGSAAAFDRAAAAEAAGGPGGLTFALLRPTVSGFVVIAAQGPGLRLGDDVSGVRADTLRLAMRTSQLVATPVIGTGQNRVLGFALGPPAAPAGVVVYRESALGPVSAPRQAGTAPFNELNVVVYASPSVESAQVLVSTTASLPLHGSVRFQPLMAGASHWLLGVAAKHPLVGSVAANAMWVELAGGLAGAALVALAIEVEARRRDAALALYESEHRVAETLQRSLLPVLPAFPGLELAARYVAGGADQEVGGDWFDAFPIAGGGVGLVIGDVVGHDVVAAAAMAQIRAALRAYAWQGDEPAVVLDRLDQFVNAFASVQLVTVFYSCLDPPAGDGSRMLRFANAGHLPPLVKAPDGQVRPLAGGGSPVIGGPFGAVRDQADLCLSEGSTLLLFTDGLVEVPGDSLDDSLTQLAATVTDQEPRVSAGLLCERVLASMPAGRPRDDIALLAVRVLPAQRRDSGPSGRTSAETVP